MPRTASDPPRDTSATLDRSIPSNTSRQQNFSPAREHLWFSPGELHCLRHIWPPAALGFVVVASMLLASAPRAGAAAVDEPVSFRREIAPLLAQKCLACHDAEKAKGGYRLDTFERLMKPGASQSPSVTPGQPARSKLLELLVTKDADDRMPQKDEPFSIAQTSLIERWIKQGAKFDGPDPALPLAILVPRAPHTAPPKIYPRPVAVTALAFHPGGHELAAAGYHEVTIWNAADGTLRRRLTNITERVTALAFTADGATLAVAGGAPGKLGEAKLIDARTGETRLALGWLPDLVLALAFSPDGKSIATGGTDHAIRVFGVADGRQRILIEQHADWILDLAYSPDGTHLISASRDKSARVFDAKTGSLENSYSGHNEAVSAVAFAPDGKLVFTAGRDREVHAWNPADAKKSRELTGVKDEALRLLATPAGLLSGGVEGKVRLHEFAKNEPPREFAGLTDQVCSLASDSAGRQIAAGDHSGNVLIWNAQTGAVLAHFIAAPGYQPARAAK